MNPKRHIIGRAADIPPGGRQIVEIDGRSIGIFNLDGRFYALKNRCPHQGAPLCTGTLTGTMLPAGPQEYTYGLHGRVLRCPWHFWEFDITTGEMILVPDPLRVKTYPVALEQPTLETYEVAIEDAMVVLYV